MGAVGVGTPIRNYSESPYVSISYSGYYYNSCNKIVVDGYNWEESKMKVWIGHDSREYVAVFPWKPKPKWWDKERKIWCQPLDRLLLSRVAPAICRSTIARLLRGTGKNLPKPGTNELVEVELFVK